MYKLHDNITPVFYEEYKDAIVFVLITIVVCLAFNYCNMDYWLNELH